VALICVAQCMETVNTIIRGLFSVANDSVIPHWWPKVSSGFLYALIDCMRERIEVDMHWIGHRHRRHHDTSIVVRLQSPHT
jgi:hypothetical protein